MRRDARAAFRLQAMQFLASGRYRGLIVDFETFPPNAQPGYLALLQELSTDLHSRAMKLYVAVPPHSSEYNYPAIAAAAMLAFTVSIDDYVITSLVAGIDSQTLPMVIYAMARRGVSPMLNAVSTVIVMGLGVLVIASERLRSS